MDDLRDTFRAALEEEWGDRRDRPGLEGRVASRLTEAAGGGTHRRERLLAVSAAALGVVLVGALGVNAIGLLAAGKHPVPVSTNPVTQGSPNPMPSPTVAAEPDYGPAPIGTPLFYYVDPRERTWMVAMDWIGKPRGTLKLPQPIEDTGGYGGGVLLAAPDGSRVFLGSQVVDAQGHATSGALTIDKQSFTWADDSRHLCQMSPQQPPESAGRLPLTLMTFLPGGPPRASGRVGTLFNQAGAQPYACSFRADQALVVQAYNQAASDSWLVRLSNGAVLHHQTYPGDGASSVGLVVSHDGAYIAANTTTFGTAPGSAATVGPSVIRSGVSGARLATMPAGLRVTGFSWDGSLAVLQGPTDTGPVAEVRVVDWRTGRVVWRLGTGKAPGSAGAPLALDQLIAGPAGRDLALSFVRLTPCPTPEATPGPQLACGSSHDRLRDIILVHGDGSSQEVAAQVQPVW